MQYCSFWMLYWPRANCVRVKIIFTRSSDNAEGLSDSLYKSQINYLLKSFQFTQSYVRHSV